MYNEKLLQDFSLTIANPTQNLTCIQNIEYYLNSEASYILIPGIGDESPVDPWKIVKELFPYSKNILIDICLPYEDPKAPKHTNNRHTARYFILNEKLLGIRVKTSDTWKPYRKERFRLPQQIIRQYYKDPSWEKTEQNENYHVGHFYLAFNHFKLAPIFQSQLSNSKEKLEEYEKYGCEIFSVVDDIPRKQITQSNNIKHLLFEKKERTANIYIYSGIKSSTNPLTCYWTNPFVIYGKTIKQHLADPFSDNASIQLDINLLYCRKNKLYHKIKFEEQKIITSLNCRKQIIKFSKPNCKKDLNDKSMDNSKFVNGNILMVYVWNLYRSINKRNSFVVGLPLTEKCASLVNLLQDIMVYIKQNKNLSQPRALLVLYKVEQSLNQDKPLWPPSLNQICSKTKVHSSLHSLLKNKSEEFYFYATSVNQIQKIKQQQDPRIRICSSLLTDQFLTNRIDNSFLRQDVEIKDPRKSSLEKLCDDIISKNLSTLENMVISFRRKNNNVDELKEAFTVIIPNKLKHNVNFNPPHLFLLRSTKQEIRISLEQVESKSSSVLKGPARRNEEQAAEVHEQKTLDVKLKKILAFKQNHSKTYTTCHRCNEVLRKTYMTSCPKCRQSFCYDCLYKTNQVPNKNINLAQFNELFINNCSVCKKTCRCLGCVEKNKALQKDKQQDKPKKSRSINQIPNCFSCQLNGRKRMAIDIQCINCKQTGCVTCLKLEKQINDNYFSNNWTCSKCSVNQIGHANNKYTSTSTTFLNENQTVEGIKRRVEFEEMRQKQIIEREMNIEMNNPKKVSQERSRNKGKKREAKSSSSSNSSSSSSSSSKESNQKKNRHRKSRSNSRSKFWNQDDKKQGKINWNMKSNRDNEKGSLRGKKQRGKVNWQDRNSNPHRGGQRNYQKKTKQFEKGTNNQEIVEKNNQCLWDSNNNTSYRAQQKKDNQSNNLLIDTNKQVVEQEFDY